MADKLIDRNPDILGGTPVFSGTRVPVRTLMEHLEAGDRLDEFLEDFPTVSREQAVEVLERPGGPSSDRYRIGARETGATGLQKNHAPPSIGSELCAGLCGRNHLDLFQPIEREVTEKVQRIRHDRPIQPHLWGGASLLCPSGPPELDAEVSANVAARWRPDGDASDLPSKIVTKGDTTRCGWGDLVTCSDVPQRRRPEL